MQFMQMLKASLTPRRSVFATLAMVAIVAAVLGLAPRVGDQTKAATCDNPPTTPTFNYWPVTYDDVNTPFCHDFPAIDAALDVTNPRWSQSEADWNDGLTLQVGDKAAAQLYLHNGAANNLDPSITTARNVHIITRTDTTPGSSHQISVTYTADNAATYTKSFTIHTPENSKLEVVPNSGFMYDYNGNLLPNNQHMNMGNSDIALGDLQACFEYSLFFTFKFKVVSVTPPPQENTNLTITKGVRNITIDDKRANPGLPHYNSSVTAVKGDRVGYRVVVTNTGNAVAHNVTMTDTGVTGIRIDSSSVVVSRVDNPNSDVNQPAWSGSLPGTLNLGDLQPSESRYIFYSGTVTTNDCEDLVNTAKAKADSTNNVSATAKVEVTNCNHGGGGNVGHPHIVISKRAFNDTKNVEATSRDAARGDYITYSLVVKNDGNADERNFVIKDDLSQVLPLADMVATNGGTVSGNMISYPSMTINEGETIVKTFQVRVKTSLDQNLAYQLRNTYGNTIVINVPGKIVYQAPKTGAAGTSAGIFAGLVTAGFVIVRKRDSILKFIFA